MQTIVHGTDHFTIYDFVKAYEHFNDAEWDGEPLDPEPITPRPGPDPASEPPELAEEGTDMEGAPPRRQKVKGKLADGKERLIQHMSTTTYWSPEGTPMSGKQFIERPYGELPSLFKDEDQLRELWGRPDTRKALLEPGQRGFGEAQLREMGQTVIPQSCQRAAGKRKRHLRAGAGRL